MREIDRLCIICKIELCNSFPQRRVERASQPAKKAGGLGGAIDWIQFRSERTWHCQTSGATERSRKRKRIHRTTKMSPISHFISSGFGSSSLMLLPIPCHHERCQAAMKDVRAAAVVGDEDVSALVVHLFRVPIILKRDESDNSNKRAAMMAYNGVQIG